MENHEKRDRDAEYRAYPDPHESHRWQRGIANDDELVLQCFLCLLSVYRRRRFLEYP
jgi:hypothetical protein